MRTRTITSAVALMIGLAACSGSSSSNDTSTTNSTSGAASATLLVISTQVTVAATKAQPAAATTGQSLSVGDTIRTTNEGFAQVKFFDGSLTRIDHAAAFTLTDLKASEGARVVHTKLDAGRSWNRIKKLSESQTWQQDTPVAQATVRGTAFAVECTPDQTACTFTVVEGIVRLTLPDGTTIDLHPNQQLTLTNNKPAPAITQLSPTQLANNQWITTNTQLDKQATPTPNGVTTTISKPVALPDPCTLLTPTEATALGNALASDAPTYSVGAMHAPVASTDPIGRNQCSWPFDYAPPHQPSSCPPPSLCTGGGGHVTLLVASAPTGFGSCAMVSASEVDYGSGPWDRAAAGSGYAIIAKNGVCVRIGVDGIGGTPMSTYAKPYLTSIAHRVSGADNAWNETIPTTTTTPPTVTTRPKPSSPTHAPGGGGTEIGSG